MNSLATASAPTTTPPPSNLVAAILELLGVSSEESDMTTRDQ
jgi:hypothetical protein